MSLIRIVCLPLILILGSCGAEDAHPDEHAEGESLVDEAREHAASGPYLDVTAAADATDAPSAKQPHHLVRVALVPVEGGNGGTVAYAAEEAGDFAIFTTADVPLSVTSAAGDPVDSQVDPLDDCTEVVARHTVALSVGTFHLTLGPTSDSSVGLVIEHLSDEP